MSSSQGASGQPSNPQEKHQQENFKKARIDQENLEAVSRIQSDEEMVMERLTNAAQEHHEIALLWEQRGDEQMAQKARALESQALDLIDRLAKLENMVAHEGAVLQSEIRKFLS